MANTAKKTAAAPKDDDRNTGTAAPEAAATSDTALADAAGITEGEVHALRDEAGLNQGAGHESNIHAWSVSPSGKEFKKTEKDREKAQKDEEKSYKDQFAKDDKTEAEKAYYDAVDKA